ncbi:threonylcarbamoyl-AMP synthase [Patescibacteria group bacterium]|nr:threonylcarbamoyl-AMP synthase [Patescibacteria group bacterium]MBU1563508.1 threonylcarbamoyl-AMP synthase [Patescibacteria group bacterium]MBU2068441.1 threonylcarbamoyl-AMP synthase [Patescibacteria group bacterium]
MEIIKFDDDHAIELAVKVIKRGGSIIYPTDTVYGLGVSALNLHAVERLFKIKKRPESKPAPIMVKNIEMAKKLAYIDAKTERILREVWPGQVTVVLEKRSIVPDILTAGLKTVGLRIPNHYFTQLLMENLNEPITATSANFSGEPSLGSAAEIIKIFNNAYPRPDLILDARELPLSPPSTVLDLTSSQPKITRVGPISKKDLMEMLK